MGVRQNYSGRCCSCALLVRGSASRRGKNRPSGNPGLARRRLEEQACKPHCYSRREAQSSAHSNLPHSLPKWNLPSFHNPPPPTTHDHVQARAEQPVRLCAQGRIRTSSSRPAGLATRGAFVWFRIANSVSSYFRRALPSGRLPSSSAATSPSTSTAPLSSSTRYGTKGSAILVGKELKTTGKLTGC